MERLFKINCTVTNVFRIKILLSDEPPEEERPPYAKLNINIK